MKKIILLLTGAISMSFAYGQVGTWPTNSAYVYFGANELNQSVVGNYATLQDKTNGNTFLNSPSSIFFRIGNNDKMLLSNAGNFGIGTTNPVTKLQVDINSANAVYSQTTVGLFSRNNSLTDNNYNGLNFGDAYGWGVAGIMSQIKSHANHTANLSFFTRKNGAQPSPQMLIDENGNVGIGTTAPIRALHINGELSVTRADKFAFINVSDLSGNGGGSIVLRGLDAAGSTQVPANISLIGNTNIQGNVGIGNTAPISPLTIGWETGTIASGKGIALGSDQNAIEFLNSPFGYGYGAKLYGTVDGPGLTSFRLGVRGATAIWTDAFYVRAADNGAGGGKLGYVGFGTNNPDERVTVNGSVHAKEVKVDLSVQGPDYVFSHNYQLPTLDYIKTYIDQNKHLPEVPSAKEMETNGVKLGEMNMILLKKIEELTLYVIELKKENEEQKIKDRIQQKEIDELRTKR